MSEKRHTAFITGSGRNIGRAVALALAADGLNVIINGSTRRELCEPVAEEARAMGVEAAIILGDIGNKDELTRMSAAALEQFGTVDVLVNNARDPAETAVSRDGGGGLGSGVRYKP